jgi:F-type H+-transporting ATPase subunit b
MPFDWFTVAAQIINFIVLLWLLKRFLYHPILEGLDARERRLKKVLEDANHKNAQAEQLQQEFAQKQQTLELQRNTILKKAHEEANDERKKLFSAAQEAADGMLRKRLEAMQHELQHLQQQILRQNIEEVYATAEKILKDLAGIELQHAMTVKFVTQLKNLQGKQYSSLLKALDRADNKVVLRSAFELSDRDKAQIMQSLQGSLSQSNSTTLRIEFMYVPELVAGLELSVSGWKLAWSINHYLQTLQTQVSELFKLKPLQSDVKPEPMLESMPEHIHKHSEVAHHS